MLLLPTEYTLEKNSIFFLSNHSKLKCHFFDVGG